MHELTITKNDKTFSTADYLRMDAQLKESASWALEPRTPVDAMSGSVPRNAPLL
jgi:hypothetical protein